MAPKAVDKSSDIARFKTGTDDSEGRISDDGQSAVHYVSLDSFCAEGHLTSDRNQNGYRRHGVRCPEGRAECFSGKNPPLCF